MCYNRAASAGRPFSFWGLRDPLCKNVCQIKLNLSKVLALKLPASTFTTTDWSMITPTIHPGDTGHAEWRLIELGDLRIRHVTYSPNYLADHWCDRGHILYVLSGSLTSELKDGRIFELKAGMSYHVSDFGDPAHRSRTSEGATLFIVD
jgi:mannose-6-phosphate isomerase-like protein (cupin superfamily)